jgi:poly(A) polymerase
MREIWMLQPRFERRSGRNPVKLLEHLRVRAGYDFLMLRCAADEAPAELGEWWTRFMEANEAEREALLAAPQARSADSGAPKRRRRRGRRGNGGNSGNGSSDARAAAASTNAIPDNEGG